jgi:hypothetical protein
MKDEGKPILLPASCDAGKKTCQLQCEPQQLQWVPVLVANCLALFFDDQHF